MKNIQIQDKHMMSKKTPHPNHDTDYSTPSIPVGGNETIRRYHAYLLRIWREDERMPWRAQIEDPTTNETVSFPSLDDLIAFLTGLFKEKSAV